VIKSENDRVNIIPETFFNSQRIKASETFPALGPESLAPIKNNTEDEDDQSDYETAYEGDDDDDDDHEKAFHANSRPLWHLRVSEVLVGLPTLPLLPT
jgi:hypothetical protein